MPRRLVTSEIWTNEKFGSLDIIGRLVFLGLITHADDDGRTKGSPNYLKARIFPYDHDITSQMVNKALDLCHTLHLIVRYNLNGSEYIYLPHWEQHQQIRGDRYKPSTLPPPDIQEATTGKPTGNRLTTIGKRNIIEDNISKDNIKKRDDKKTLSSPTGLQIKEVFARLDKFRGYRPTKRKAEASAILRMLKVYTPDQIIETWETLKKDKFWANKELYMMTIESQIGAILKNGQTPKHQSDVEVIK